MEVENVGITAFTKQAIADAGQKAKLLLSELCGQDLTSHAPHNLQKEINAAVRAGVTSEFLVSSTGDEIVSRLYDHVQARRIAIDEAAKENPALELLKNDLSLAVTVLATQLGLKNALYAALSAPKAPLDKFGTQYVRR